MNQQRLEQLLSFYKEDPNDPFTIYALATEYKETEPKEALKYFNILLKDHEEYVGTYYHVCSLFQQLGMNEQAEENYIKGLQMCRKTGNMHALSELQQAYNKFQGLDYEDD